MADPLDNILPPTDPLTSGALASAAAAAGQVTQSAGAAVSFLGKVLSVLTSAESASIVPGYLPDGPGGNAQDTDPRSFKFTRADLAAVGSRDPRAGDTLTWVGFGDYTVTRAFYIPDDDSVKCLAYRPGAPAGAQDAAQLAVWTGY